LVKPLISFPQADAAVMSMAQMNQQVQQLFDTTHTTQQTSDARARDWTELHKDLQHRLSDCTDVFKAAQSQLDDRFQQAYHKIDCVANLSAAETKQVVAFSVRDWKVKMCCLYVRDWKVCWKICIAQTTKMLSRLLMFRFFH
jgi:hypothetical protein